MGCANVKGMPRKSATRKRFTQPKENKFLAQNNSLDVCLNRNLI